MNDIFGDIRFSFRMLRKNGVVTAAAVLSLALAIGACTAAFSLIDALILRPLPVRDPASLVYLAQPRDDRPGIQNSYFSYPLYERLSVSSSGYADLFGVNFGGPLRSAVFDDAAGEEEKVRVESISGKGFGTLGIGAAVGRVSTAADDAQGAVVLSHDFWRRRFGRSSAVLGRWVRIGGQQLQIIGVAEKTFSGLEPGYMTDVWIPIGARADAQIWGRLRPGVKTEQARQVLQAAFTNFRRDQRVANDTLRARTLLLQSAARGVETLVRWQFERPLWIAGMIAVLVFVIAGSNVANLLMARGAARQHEMAMRISLGAGRARLLRQMLIESGLLAAAACALGLGVAVFAAHAIVSLLAPADYPVYLDLRVDVRQLAFLMMAGVSSTLLFGIAPALRASSISPHAVLKSQSDRHSGRIGMLRPLLTAQVAFSFAVLFIAGLLLLSFQRLLGVDLGFSKSNVVLMSIGSRERQKGDAARIRMLQLLDDVRQVPGVQAAGMSGTGLIGGATSWVMSAFVRLPGRTDFVKPLYLEVSPGFFDAMQIRLLEGRDFVARDSEAKSEAVIVNRAFATKYFGGWDPLGKRFERQLDDPAPVPQEIVGVVADAKYNNVREPMAPTLYSPLRQVATLEVRAASDAPAMIPKLREEIRRVDGSLQVASVTLQSTQIGNTLIAERLLALLAGFFAAVAVMLAGVGLYGVISYSVVRRTREIGIRIALGARESSVIRLIMSDVARTAVVGVAIGLAGGLILARFVAALLFEVKPSGFWSLALPIACLLAASALAALPPALRATRVDPGVALRVE